MTPEPGPAPRRHTPWALCLLVGLYVALRWLLIPAAGEQAAGFSHASAYLTTVAANLRAGRGYVNDAHWLVFLRPASLPMPYHNANRSTPPPSPPWPG